MRYRLLHSFLLTATTPFLNGCSEDPPPPAEPIAQVKVFTVGKRATGQSRRISGKVQAANKSTLSFGVSGTIAEVIAKIGQRVNAGQLLARLDPEPMQRGLADARTDVKTARAKLIEAEALYNRTKKLFASKGAARQEVDAATMKLAAARGDLDAAKRGVENAERDLKRTSLTAPFTGQVVEVTIDAFQEVGATESAVVLQSVDALEVRVRVPETMIRDVDYSQVVSTSFPSLEGVTVQGSVSNIGAEAESGNAFPVTIRLGKTEADVRAGMTASVTFNFDAYLGDKVAYLIPLSAIAIEAGLVAGNTAEPAKQRAKVPVFLLDEASGKIKLQQVRIGDLRGNELEVFEGLKPGDKLISAGVAFLRDGMPARIWQGRQGAR